MDACSSLGLIKDEYASSLTSGGVCFNLCRKKHSLRKADVQMFEIWVFQLSVLVIVTPRYL